MISNKLNFKILAELTIEKLISLPLKEQETTLALVFLEVYQTGSKDLQKKVLMSLPDHLNDTSH